MTRTEFIKKVAAYVQKYAPEYGIKVCSPIIAQACLESAYGTSKLSSKYFNFFGLKCGTKWTGKSVNMTTQEEYSSGTLTTIKDNFRVYGSMEEGVKGYFEFIQLTRYQNLKGITDPEKYLDTIKADGYATDSSYVKKNMAVVKQYNLTQYDTTKEAVTTATTKTTAINKLIEIAKAEIGYLEKASNKNLDDKTANAGSANYTRYWAAIKPAYQGQPWCACFVTWCFVQAFGQAMAKKLLKHYPYVYCPTMASLFTLNANPKVGDIVIFKHSGTFAHTGIVIAVNGDKFTTIEGNTSGASGIIANGGGVCQKSYYNNNLPGTKFCTPDYSLVSGSGSSGSTTTDATSETKADTKTDTKTNTTSGGLNKTQKFVGKVTASKLSVRSYAGTSNALIKSYPYLAKGNLVSVCDTVKADDGSDWYYVKIADMYYGFVSAQYIKKQ